MPLRYIMNIFRKKKNNRSNVDMLPMTRTKHEHKDFLNDKYWFNAHETFQEMAHTKKCARNEMKIDIDLWQNNCFPIPRI